MDLFWWIVLIFIALLIRGVGWGYMGGSIWNDGWGESWGSVWRPKWKPRKTDFELRQEFRRTQSPEVVVVKADDYIDTPDNHIERLIEEEKLDEAREYRLEMEKIAEEMNDDDALREYAVYGARIARKQREIEERRIRMAREELRAREEEIRLAFEKKETIPESPAMEVIAAPAIEPVSTGPRTGAPPLWQRKTRPEMGKTEEIDRSIAKPPPEKPAPLAPPLPVEAPPKPTPPPKPVEIPPDFTPPPPGPIQLGESSVYTYPSETDKPKPPAEPEKKGEEEEKKEKIDPDEYTDLISL